MNCADKNMDRVTDYVFMCFFLGNDFMPRFPAIQIRSHGITFLLDTYREHIGKFNGRRLVNHRPTMATTLGNNAKGGVVNWGWLGLFIQKLATNERNFIILEDEARDKMEAGVRRMPDDNDVENMPILYREVERYVCPKEPGWEWRYYNGLFDSPPTPELQKGWCLNYLEGLEWTFKYYTGECPDWRWVYRNEYPPLLRDLQMNVPRAHNWEYFPRNKYKQNAHTSEEQLAYVMPPLSQSAEEKGALVRRVEWKWSYCRYLWESQLVVPTGDDDDDDGK
jgi:5'-3' exonuclease